MLIEVGQGPTGWKGRGGKEPDILKKRGKGKKRSDEQEQAETVQLIYDLKGPNQP